MKIARIIVAVIYVFIFLEAEDIDAKSVDRPRFHFGVGVPFPFADEAFVRNWEEGYTLMAAVGLGRADRWEFLLKYELHKFTVNRKYYSGYDFSLRTLGFDIHLAPDKNKRFNPFAIAGFGTARSDYRYGCHRDDAYLDLGMGLECRVGYYFSVILRVNFIMLLTVDNGKIIMPVVLDFCF